MTNQIQLIARSAQAFLAVAATVASVIVFQFASKRPASTVLTIRL
jgi:hypothetical protein